MHCKKCGGKLTAKEINEIQESAEYSAFPAERICNDCWEEEENMEQAIDDFSDADPGL